MKVIQSSFFRAVCAFVVGALLVKYSDDAATGLTIAIGVLFFLSGVVSCITYYVQKRHAGDVIVYDADGTPISGMRPSFPIAGLGSLVLGVVLALMPATFITGVAYVLAAILILGTINQFVYLVMATRWCRVGWGWWVFPSILLLVGIVVIIRPSIVATAPLIIIGWALMVYAVVEAINTIKISKARKTEREAERRQAEALEAAAEAAESASTATAANAEEDAADGDGHSVNIPVE